MNKKSFILHNDSLDILDQLTNEQAGKLFKAISTYQKVGKITNLDQLLKIVITPFLNQFKRDDESFNKSVLMGKIGNLKKYHKEIYNRYIAKELSLEEAEAIAYPYKKEIDRPPIVPDRPRSLNDSVNDSVNDNDKEEQKNLIKKAQDEMLEDEKRKLAERSKAVIKIPDWINSENWNEWLKARKKKKYSESPQAFKAIINTIEKFKADGYTTDQINISLESSMIAGYPRVYEPKTTKQTKATGATQAFQNTMRNAQNVINRHKQKNNEN